MSRAPFQVLVLPWRHSPSGSLEFALFRRADDNHWQGIAGGGEDDETPNEAARREAFEEAGIPPEATLVRLQSVASIPVIAFHESSLWGTDLYVIPEYAFGVDVQECSLELSDEHSEFRWLQYAAAHDALRYDSNRVALWELNQRIRRLGPRDISF